jgi:hypothetical protein
MRGEWEGGGNENGGRGFLRFHGENGGSRRNELRERIGFATTFFHTPRRGRVAKGLRSHTIGGRGFRGFA